MPINISRYVNITSGVGAGISVSTRSLITRIYTDNPLVPPGTSLEFSAGSGAATLALVGAYFGFTSAEYLRAQFYFGWISKAVTTPQKISFARWVNTASPARIYGATGTYALSTFTPISTGSLNLTLNGFSTTLTGINLSAAGSLTAVASAIQTAVRAYSAGGTDWTGATVAYDATNNRFTFVGGNAAPGSTDIITVGTAGTGTDLAPLVGWQTGQGGIFANGSPVETLTNNLTNSAAANNNFGSFLYITPTSGTPLTQAQILEIAIWNDAQNNLYMFLVPVSSSNAAAITTAISGYEGSAVTLSPLATEYPEMVPGMILAATDYTARNSVKNYMYQIFTLTPSVTTDAAANTYDAQRVNYYGITQTAGQLLAFYQRGYMMGLSSSDPLDQNTYANEQWLKDAAQAAVMTAFLGLDQIPANTTGRAQLLAVLHPVVDQALFNGTISVGKTLTPVQQLYITNATGDNTAWRQVQSQGFWLNVIIQPYTDPNTNTLAYKAVYTLIYGKDDIIRQVSGTHVLI